MEMSLLFMVITLILALLYVAGGACEVPLKHMLLPMGLIVVFRNQYRIQCITGIVFSLYLGRGMLQKRSPYFKWGLWLIMQVGCGLIAFSVYMLRTEGILFV
jgi:hypothetical protein